MKVVFLKQFGKDISKVTAQAVKANYAKKDVQKFIEAIENPTIGLQQWINRQ